MEKIFTRYVVTLVFAVWASACFADIDENFNTLEVARTAILDGWTLTNCEGAYHGGTPLDKSNIALHFRNSSTAVTPAVGKACNAKLTFSFANTSANQSRFRVTVVGGGSFDSNIGDGTFNSDCTSWTRTITTGSGTYTTKTLEIYGVREGTCISFSVDNAYYFVIDDLKLTTFPLTISETGTATTFEAQLADVTLGRTLSADVWSTLCLPFDVTTEAMLAATGATEVKMCTFYDYADGTMTFKKTDEVTAGKPFLIKVNTTVINPTFLLVNMKSEEAQTVTYGDVSMVGRYGQTNLNADGERVAVFLTADGTLKRPSAASSMMNGLRAYFIVHESFAGARVMIDDEEVTAIDAVLKPESTGDGELYSLTGQRQHQSARPGIYINNGKKVIIK